MDRFSRTISFRLIAPADVPNLVRWQLDPEVAVWWDHPGVETEESLQKKWLSRAEGTSTPDELQTRPFIIVVDDTDIGYIQAYELRHYSVHASEIDIPNAAGLDIFIGEPEWRDKGVGTSAVGQFIDEIIFAISGIETCVIDPDPTNKRAIRSYEKAGFVYARTYYSEANKVDVYLMRQERGQR
jgi:aminoglycoside 6'-N-acetyltransferase